MKRLIQFAALALIATAASPVQARDRDDDQDRDRDRNHGEHRDQGRNNFRGRSHDQSRVIYVIEGGRPVPLTVFVDPSGGFYHMENNRTVYVRDHYYESYPSRYYTPTGRRRLFIKLPF